MDSLSLSEKLMYSTIRIETTTEYGIGTGTGFFFYFLESEQDNSFVPCLVTNKHVVNGAIEGKLIFSKSNENGTPDNRTHYNLVVNDFENQWIFHPDHEVDLCILPIAKFFRKMKDDNFQPFYIPLDSVNIPKEKDLEELKALEDIVMVGYPNGLWDSYNNLPLLRKGITASHPLFDYNNKKEFLIDAACFPGSSGSPVFIYNESGYVDKIGSVTFGRPRILFVGVLYAGPQHNVRGEIEIVDVPMIKKNLVQSLIPNNLGIVIKSEKILDFEALLKPIIEL